MTERAVAVEVIDVSKKFRLFKERNNSLKATIMRGRRIIAEDFWALKDVSFEVLRRGDLRPHRGERIWQEHHAQVLDEDSPPQ